jgi:hypothetical protein
MDDLLSLYRSLAPVSSSGDVYMARELTTRPNFRVAKDSEGNPTLLITLEPSAKPATAPLEFRYLSFRPRCICHIQAEGKPESLETVALLKCITNDPLLREYFLRSLNGSVPAVSIKPTEDELVALVEKLIELFRAMETPARTSLQGVWCELFLIARAPRIRQASIAWHADPRALHDFTAGRQRLEVKSTTAPHRILQFRMEQLLPLHGTQVVIASFCLEESGSGVSIEELWSEISANRQLTIDLRERLSQILALSLGNDWRKASRVAFDPQVALNKFRIYDSAVIPKVDPNVPAEVSEIHFTSELTDVPQMSRAEVIRNGGLFEAIFG